MLTATPHSGDELGYWNLLSLLHRDFGRLGKVSSDERQRLRLRLAARFVQRRRIDIDAWKSQKGTFPKHERLERRWPLAQWAAERRATLVAGSTYIFSASVPHFEGGSGCHATTSRTVSLSRDNFLLSYIIIRFVADKVAR